MVLFALFAVGLAVAAYRSATITTVVLVRHAEKELGTIEDPPLAPEGERHAERLAQMFGDAGPGRIDAIYVTDARRTQQTVAPLAARLGMRPTVFPAADIDATAARVLREHRGGRVLIVAHGNTVPALVRKLSGMEVPPPVGDNEYDDIYVVVVPTFGDASMLRLKY